LFTTYHYFATTPDEGIEAQRRIERQTQVAVYKIKCCDCQTTYIGETDRNLNIRLTEHKRATGNGDINNHISEHHYQQTAESTETLQNESSTARTAIKESI